VAPERTTNVQKKAKKTSKTVKSKAKKVVRVDWKKTAKSALPRHVPANKRKVKAATKELTVKLPLAFEVTCDWDDTMISTVIHGVIGADFGIIRCGDATEHSGSYGTVFVEHVVVYASGGKNDHDVQALVKSFAPKDEEKVEEKNVGELLANVRTAMHALESAMGVAD
jgi:hypothetical protein